MSSIIDQLIAAINKSKTSDDYHRALRKVYSEYDDLRDSIINKIGINLACHDGCSLCCGFRVDVRAPEVFLVASYISKYFSDEQKNNIEHLLSKHSEYVAPFTTIEHLKKNIECPLLQDNRCSIYPVRPFGCRRHHAQDLTACQYSYNHPDDLQFIGTQNPKLAIAFDNALAYVHRAYASLGFDNTGYEFGSALFDALSNSSCWERWLNHKKTFLHSPVTAPIEKKVVFPFEE